MKRALVVALFCSVPARPARASRPFVDYIPNGNAFNCMACHTMTNPPDYNLFGAAVMSTLSGGNPNWSALWMLDSDNDGQTNGQELGDPCGVWRVGQPAPRTTEISNPAGRGSTSATPDEPPCAPPDAGLLDSGAPADAQLAEAGAIDTGIRDVGLRVDAGAMIGAEVEADEGGCSCTSARGESSPFFALFLFVFALLLSSRASAIAPSRSRARSD